MPNDLRYVVICDRDGWTWRIEEQQDVGNAGVDLVYAEEGASEKRLCLGSVEDATALKDALGVYLSLVDPSPLA